MGNKSLSVAQLGSELKACHSYRVIQRYDGPCHLQRDIGGSIPVGTVVVVQQLAPEQGFIVALPGRKEPLLLLNPNEWEVAGSK
jgi:hypothetical protein